jgi:hypothetical protein
MTMDLRIDLLRLNLMSGAGHEHRIEPIALRAATLLAERLAARCAAGAHMEPQAIDAVAAPAVSIDMARTSDSEAAGHIADAWLAAFLLHAEA